MNQSIQTLRGLSIDGVKKANSGHTGICLGAAPMAYTLFTRHLQIDPKNPMWFNRDRFILSAGHGSMLLYSLLHLSGFNVTIDDLKNFRQLHSKTPGHPEYGYTEGVEATSGPLGQGISTAVGLAMGEAHLGARFNKENYALVDHYTYALCGDGDLMEGVSSEASSLAGHLGLSKLIVLYDSNDICLDGPISDVFTEDVAKRYEAYNWDVSVVEAGEDVEAISAAIEAAKQTDKPSLIMVKTTIGYGSPLAGKNTAHGALTSDEAIAETKKALGLSEVPFTVNEEVYADFAEHVAQRGANVHATWKTQYESYKKEYPEEAALFDRAVRGEGISLEVSDYSHLSSEATRNVSGLVLNEIAKQDTLVIGGSADLASSNKTMLDGEVKFDKGSYEGRNLWFGVREFAMGTILNGLALHGGIRPYGGGFLVFSDYMRGAIRMAALMNLPVTYVFTHDSVAVGEDGPTHQPIEHLNALRVMPNVTTLRPADAREVAAAWKVAYESTTSPTALILTRQNVSLFEGSKKASTELQKGAYVAYGPQPKDAMALLIASGSEVGMAIEAAKELELQEVQVTVISMPSTDLFDQQSAEYKEEILPKSNRNRVAVEMGNTDFLRKYVGLDGDVLGIDTFGASAPFEAILEDKEFTVESLVRMVLRTLDGNA